METIPRILYPHAWFARIGESWTTPSAGGPVGPNTKPPVNAATVGEDDVWMSLGRLASIQETPTMGIRKEIWTGSPGKLVLGDEIGSKLKQEIMAQCQDLTEIGLQLLYAGQNFDLDLSTTDKQFNPMAGTPILKGWLKIQYYDHDNNAILFIDRWGGLSFEGSYDANGDNNEFQLKHTVYHSQYNTGELMPT